MTLHINPAATKGYAFGFEAQALFNGGVAAKLDFAASAKDSLPRQAEGTSQNPDDLAGSAGIACAPGHGTISGNLAAGNFADRGSDAGLHGHGATDGRALNLISRYRSGSHSLAERFDRCLFALINVENRDQFGHLQ